MQWYVALGSGFLLLIAIFAYQNPQEVTLRFITWEMPPIPLVLLIFFSTAMGALITLLFSLAKQLTQGMKIRELQNKLKHLEKQIPSAGAPGENNPPAGKGRGNNPPEQL
ncbi:hypothetical protein DCCM_2087 [Desulfocucumis palustris]|uniref:Lipopolysaccharide assembly protein A domain-containing protein n=1 Tax=Desulfocucumis palustris TaxID=1898651 RepID=A0A2L2XA90_9FIRM|nr:LapA family protein [Desulfocucumis palustris]GBF32990.1 hypothetical protein DCCM_2087 [Desulfocucumis palustris]